MKNDSNVKSNCAGTARALHELKQIRSMEEEYGEETAVSLTTTVIRRRFPTITEDDVRGTIKVIRMLESGDVDIATGLRQAEAQAVEAAGHLIGALLRPVSPVVG